MRKDWGRLLAVLIANLGDFQLAEDALSDAFERALVHWPVQRPTNPQGWLLQVARRRAIDHMRRRRTRRHAQPDLAYLAQLAQTAAPALHDIPDERLRLIFTACHPALSRKTQIALTLRTLCGLSTAALARAFLDKEATMAQRLSRAKTKIAKAKIPYVVPGPDAFSARLSSVLDVVYLIFNAGHGTLDDRESMCREAIRLARAVVALCPTEPEAMGLLALLLLTHARSAARMDTQGQLVALEAQDRTLWDRAAIAEGLALVTRALRRGRPGPFQLQAAIAAIHAEAPDFRATGWGEIALIYDRLLDMTGSPVVAVNRAVAISFAHSPAVGLAQLPVGLERYQPALAARADMLRRLGDTAAARAAYDDALRLTTNPADHAWLRARRASLDADEALSLPDCPDE